MNEYEDSERIGVESYHPKGDDNLYAVFASDDSESSGSKKRRKVSKPVGTSVSIDRQEFDQDNINRIGIGSDSSKKLDMEIEISSVLDQISDRSSLGSLTLESMAKSFLDLQTRFPDDYTMLNLSSVAFSYASPFFIRMFSRWDPLQNPTHGLELVSFWRKLLQSNDSSTISGSICPYTQLIKEAVFPAVRISATNSMDPEPMLRFLESWEELLPPPVLQTLLDTIIIPKISAAVESWDPRVDSTIPLHSWIHPWLPLLGNNLDNCRRTIRVKLADLLRAWQPSDLSAHRILAPWRTVFGPASWEQLTGQYIIPKLMAVIHDLPMNENLDRHFSWVRPWLSGVVPSHQRRQLVDGFFYRMQEMLYRWLSPEPDFGEAREGYLRWKGVLPREVQEEAHVRFNLNLCLEMMMQAVDGREVQPPQSYLRFRRTAARAA